MHAHGLLNFTERNNDDVSAVGRYAVAPNEQVRSFIETSTSPEKILNASNFFSLVTNIWCILLFISKLARMSPVHPVHKENAIHSWSDCALIHVKIFLCAMSHVSQLNARARMSNCPQKLNRP